MGEPSTKRFRYASYNERINEINIDNGKGKGVAWVDEDQVDESAQSTPLNVELEKLQILDLTTGFQALARQVKPLSSNLPITLLNLPTLSDHFFTLYDTITPDKDHIHSGLDSALQLHLRLFETCLGEGVALLPRTVARLLELGIVKALDPKLVEKVYSTVSLILRTLAGSLLRENESANQALRQSWSELSKYLSADNKAFVRRCVVGAWVGVVHKARAKSLRRLIKLMLENEDQDGMPALWAESIKGSHESLHSRGLSVLDQLLDECLEKDGDQLAKDLMRVLTALIHHCSPINMIPIVDLLLSRIEIPRTSPNDLNGSLDKTIVLLPFISTLGFVRKGKRFPESKIKPAMLKLSEIASWVSSCSASQNDGRQVLLPLRRALSEATIACLMAGRLTHWLSPGVTLLKRVMQILNLTERIAFVSSLCELQWPGIDQFILPHISRAILPSFQEHMIPTLLLFRNLSSPGHLNDNSNKAIPEICRSMVNKITPILQDFSENLPSTPEQHQTLHLILEILPSLQLAEDTVSKSVSSISSVLLDRISSRNPEQVRESYEESRYNDLHTLAATIDASQRLPQLLNSLTLISGSERIKSMLKVSYWHREMMTCVATLVQSSRTRIRLDDELASRLRANLLSIDSDLRLSSLKILHQAVEAEAQQKIWQLCLEIEQAETTLKNVRDRNMHIRRLGRHLATTKDHSPMLPTEILNGAIQYLVSQFKVNFRPLYTETIAAFAEVAVVHGDIIWSTIWSELEMINRSPDFEELATIKVPSAWEAPQASKCAEEDEVDDDFPDLHCHNLAHSQKILASEWSDDESLAEFISQTTSAQLGTDRLNVLNYESQLLAALAASPALVERRTKDFIPLFFHITGETFEGLPDYCSHQLSTRQRQLRTSAYLEVLAKFTNPKASFRSDELYQSYLNLLSKGESKLQGHALDCIMTYKSPSVKPYEEKLRPLLDDAKFRDALLHLPLNMDSEVVNPQHRQELLPIVVRLLYGVLTSRRGRGNTTRNPAARKQAVFSALSGCSAEELKTLIDLMLEPFEKKLETADIETSIAFTPGRQQLGFLSLLSDVIRYIAVQTLPHWPRLVSNTLQLLKLTQDRLSMQTVETNGDLNEDNQDEEAELPGEDDAAGAALPLRAIRTASVKRLIQFIRSPVDFDLSPFLPKIFSSAVSPRLEKLDIENTQAASGTLELIEALAKSPSLASSLTTYDQRILPRVFACMNAPKVKMPVILKIFDIIDALIFDQEEGTSGATALSSENFDCLVANIIDLVKSLDLGKSGQVLPRLLRILSELAKIVSDGSQAQLLASLLGPMLRQANKLVSEKSKIDILQTLKPLYAISPEVESPQSDFFVAHYSLISQLFQTITLPSSRRALVATFRQFSVTDDLKRTAGLVAKLNSYSVKRMDEPDFTSRLAVFSEINDSVITDQPQTMLHWLPLVRTALFFIRDPEEFSIRTSSSALLKRFFDLVSSIRSEELDNGALYVVLPGIRQVLRSKVEMVRNEALLVLSHAVENSSHLSPLAELRPLLTEDTETNFFINLTHIQVHRRARALRRLREFIGENVVSGSTMQNVFMPILEHILSGSTEVTDHHLVNEAITTIGALTGKMVWSKYHATLVRFLRLGNVQSPQQKLYIRTVAAIIDNFHFDLKEAVVDVDMAERADLDDGPSNEGAEEEAYVAQEEQTDTTASVEQIRDTVLRKILPSLTKFVDSRQETEDTIRVPLAIPTIKLASALPAQMANIEIQRIITTISQVLRSKDQDTRDIAKDTLCKIAIFLGPSWLQKVLLDLQTALQRGPQKYVAAVVTHAILSKATTEAADQFSDLDEAVRDAIAISAEVIWGDSGKSVIEEGYKSKMREVKAANSRAFATFQMLATLASPSKISTIIVPIRDVMHASQAVQPLLQVDEALRRIAQGLNSNSKIHAEDILNLSYSLVSESSSYSKLKRKAAPTTEASASHKVQMKRDNKEKEDFFPQNAHKFIAFGLDLFITAFRRSRINLSDPQMLARLGPLVNVIGDTLYSKSTDVVTLGLKATAVIAKCPLPVVNEALPVFISNIFKIIKNAGGAVETELVQTALKSLAQILRDCSAASISHKQLKYLLEIMEPHLEESSRQGAIFALLRAVISKQIVIPEMYDMMDRVSTTMVTSQSTHAQELSRVTLMQFLLDYPQGKGRLKNQMNFLAQNLSYTFESGRVSVMEVLSAVFNKFSDELIGLYADLFFVALVAMMANDESNKCRDMAGALINQLYFRLEVDHQLRLLQVLKGWVQYEAEAGLMEASFAVLSRLCDNKDATPTFVSDAVSTVLPIIESASEALRDHTGEDDVSISASTPQTLHHAISVLNKSSKMTPELLAEIDSETIGEFLLYPHSWVRFDAAKLLCVLLSTGDTASAASEGDAFHIAQNACIALQGDSTKGGTTSTTEGRLADQIIKLLWSIAKNWAATEKVDTTKENGIEDDMAEDGVDEDVEGQGTDKHPLRWLMSRMSFIARHMIISRPSYQDFGSSTHWSVPLMSILRFFAGMFDVFSDAQAKYFAIHALNPLYRILDDSEELATAGSEEPIRELKQFAVEVRDHIQEKIGTTQFSAAWDSLRQKRTGKREERRDARARMAISDPKKWADRKSKKVIQKKESRKRKIDAFTGKRRSDRGGKRTF